MEIRREDIRRFFEEPDADPARILRDFGEAIEPILLGPDEGYIERARVFLREAVCPRLCELLGNKEAQDAVELALTIAEAITKAASGKTPVPSVALVYKTSVFLAKRGLPLVLDCDTCPTKATRTQ